MTKNCYIGMGGNFLDTPKAMQLAIQQLKSNKAIFDFTSSLFYRTTAVSIHPQPDYLNVVCRFSCDLALEELWKEMQKIEIQLGKKKKPKNAPRLIDLDLLFFGEKLCYSDRLILPHPKWHQRLFVLAPLTDLTEILPLGINVKKLLENFSNPHKEQVKVWQDLH
ncbi:MAG: 2-amino-4-hydroxy-6-hydroxymethyldihydropteridine diphosphokinase [Chlamydiales bacterium]